MPVGGQKVSAANSVTGSFQSADMWVASTMMVLTYGKRMRTATNDPVFRKLFEVLENILKVAQPGSHLQERAGGLIITGHMHLHSSANYLIFWPLGEWRRRRSMNGSVAVPNNLLGHPEVLRKALIEIDRKLDSIAYTRSMTSPNCRTLSPASKKSLGYKTNCQRLKGIPHSLYVDDIWNGYQIPKGAVIVGYVRAIHMDEAQYPDPTKFNPDRFMAESDPMRWGSGPEPLNARNLQENVTRLAQLQHQDQSRGSEITDVAPEIPLRQLFVRIIGQARGQFPKFCADNSPGCFHKSPLFPAQNVRIPIWVTTYIQGSYHTKHDKVMFSDGIVCSPRAYNVGLRARSDAYEALIRDAFEDAQAVFEVMGLARAHDGEARADFGKRPYKNGPGGTEVIIRWMVNLNLHSAKGFNSGRDTINRLQIVLECVQS
ncbi:hypothetical protein FIBSPDRAFT_927144 [Athelia psychrophila]|uniref:Cytochrome P450 n=1 Tax=Athelia psychrophila TaxID=1759441 RepID=A0A166S5Q8_9AGAM|nr:hypothetical protein FIBSPDRAFT_927144 [Fibularhizoctonia sp. CBS 109695]